jgi:hypothetical protein
MSKWSYAFVAAGALALLSCEKEIKYKGEQDEQRLVVNCITEKDSVFRVQLERSRFFLESTNGNFAITSNAVVKLTNVTTGQVVTSSSAGPGGIYNMGIPAVAGNEYTIEVTHPDYETVTAKTPVLPPVPILSVDTSSYVQQGGMYMKADVTWNDPAGKDFYVMKMALYDASQNMDIYPELSMASFDPALDEISSSEGIGNENFTNALFFTDELFDGSQKTMEVRFTMVFPQPDQHYKFILYRCTEETYKYLVSAEKAYYYGGDPFSEPVKVFTNVEKGFGIFGSMARSVFIQ